MKRILLTLLALLPATPALAITSDSFQDLKFTLLIAANLAVGGLILFLMLAIISVLWDRRKARKRAELIASRRETRMRTKRSVRTGQSVRQISAAG